VEDTFSFFATLFEGRTFGVRRGALWEALAWLFVRAAEVTEAFSLEGGEADFLALAVREGRIFAVCGPFL
jgi:hypothetical protein